MITAILLIKISPAKEQEVYNELLRIPEVVDTHVMFGEYDLIAKIKTKKIDFFNEHKNYKGYKNA